MSVISVAVMETVSPHTGAHRLVEWLLGFIGVFIEWLIGLLVGVLTQGLMGEGALVGVVMGCQWDARWSS